MPEKINHPPGQPVPEKWDTLIHIGKNEYVRIKVFQSAEIQKLIIDLLQKTQAVQSAERELVSSKDLKLALEALEFRQR